MTAALEDGLWRPFSKDDTLVVGSLGQHAHHLPVPRKLQGRYLQYIDRCCSDYTQQKARPGNTGQHMQWLTVTQLLHRAECTMVQE